MTAIAKLDPPTADFTPKKVTLDVPEDPMAKELELTDEEADAVLKDANLSKVNIRGIKAYRKLGKYLKKAGMIEYARGKLLGREEALERARDAMMGLVVGTDPVEPDVRVAAALAVNSFIKTENDTLELGLKLEKIQGELAHAVRTMNSAPPPGPLVLVQADNVSMTEKS